MENNEQKKGNVVKISMSQYKPIESTEKLNRKGWLDYGDDNKYPSYLIDMYDSAPAHGAIATSIIAMIAGKGFESNMQSEVDRLKLPELLPDISYDTKIQGGYYVEVIYTTDKTTFAAINHLPFENCRLSYSEDDNGTMVIDGVWYSRDWSDTRKKINAPRHIPKFSWHNRLNEDRQVYWHFGKLSRSRFYPKPDYERSMTWIEVEKQIGVYHMNHLLNGFFPAFMIHMMNGQVELEERTKIKRDFENQLGAGNAGGFMMTFNESDKEAPKVDAFPISDADKQYQFLVVEARNNVLIGHRVTTPLLFGVRDGGGLGSNTDEMKTGLAIFENQVIEPFQRFICDGLEHIFKEAGKELTLSVIKNTPLPETAPAQTQQIAQASEKKKPELTDDVANELLEKLAGVGERIDTDEWELISEEEACGNLDGEATCIDEIERRIVNTKQASEESFANPDEKSKWGDVGMYKLRYAYSQNLGDDTREFCRTMVELSQKGVVYRYEDIEKMSKAGVNGQFAPEGEKTYNIFEWKGGAFCHHHWKRQIYFRKRKGGKFLPNDGLKNDIRVGNNPYVPKKGEEGIAPIDTPTRGSLKYS